MRADAQTWFDLDYRVLLPDGHYLGRELAGTFNRATDDPAGFSGVGVVLYVLNFYKGDPYGYSFARPTEDRLNDWWRRGTRRFVLWEHPTSRELKYKVKFYADWVGPLRR